MSLSLAPKIQKLPHHLIDQIKAGEVIERPGFLIKEIIENSLDAGATEISLTLRQNGLELIHLIDNGHGIEFNDLPLAFERHATSKLHRFEDLQELTSYGFRGEALASIASVAKVRCLSSTHEQNFVGEYCCEGGNTIGHQKLKNPKQHAGTELIIQDLFFNTPARFKFIQSAPSEKQFLKKILTSYALIHPEVKWDWQFDQEDRVFIPAHSHFQERLKVFLKEQDLSSLLFKEKDYDRWNVKIALLPPFIKTEIKNSLFFLNQRLILDKGLLKVFQSLLMQINPEMSQGIYVIQVNTQPDAIDINIHPNKTQIKIFQQSQLISLVQSTFKEMLTQKSSVSSHAISHETQSLNLSDLREDQDFAPEQTYRYDGVFSPHALQAHHPQNQWPHITSFPFAIWNKEEKNYLVSWTKLLSLWIKTHLKENEIPTPLLISEPLDLTTELKKNYASWEKYGFEMDLVSQKILLRSTPSWFKGFPLKEVATVLLAQNPEKEINLDQLKINESQISPSTWSTFWDGLTKEAMLKASAIKEITLNDWQKWLKEK